MPDFIALRGDPSDGLPGREGHRREARRRHPATPRVTRSGPEQAEKEGPEVNSLARQAEELRAFREIATLQPVKVKRPRDKKTDRKGGAKAARELGMNGLAKRLEG